jgi:hypothetical protein
VSSSAIHSRRWREHRERVLPELIARSDGCCERCLQPIDFDAPARSSRAPSVDHRHPLAHGGELLAPVDELALVHVGCNSIRANHVRRVHGNGASPPAAPAVELAPEAPARPVAYPLEAPAPAVELPPAAPARPVVYLPFRRRRDVELAAHNEPLFDADSFSPTNAARQAIPCPRGAMQRRARGK